MTGVLPLLALVIPECSPTCKYTYAGYDYVCSFAKNMPSGSSPTSFSYTEGQQTGLRAQAVNGGVKALHVTPLESGIIKTNTSTGQLQFSPGLPDKAAKR
ncbi:MAG: hypothetical protein ACLGH0_10445 [Thermoanaerobaculia bacterium]